eukprot:355847-Chlamydomonas_euryale.AAC.2
MPARATQAVGRPLAWGHGLFGTHAACGCCGWTIGHLATLFILPPPSLISVRSCRFMCSRRSCDEAVPQKLTPLGCRASARVLVPQGAGQRNVC